MKVGSEQHSLFTNQKTNQELDKLNDEWIRSNKNPSSTEYNPQKCPIAQCDKPGSFIYQDDYVAPADAFKNNLLPKFEPNKEIKKMIKDVKKVVVDNTKKDNTKK